MISELAIATTLCGTGFALMLAVRSEFRGASVWLALPVGAGVYLVSALIELAATGTLIPLRSLVITGIVGIAALVLGTGLRHWTTGALLTIGAILVIAVTTVILARIIHLTRLTPDSLRYLLFTGDMQLPDGLDEIHRADLINRQMGLPSLQALATLTDRRYLASIGPLFGVSGLGFFVWLSVRVTRGLARRERLILVGSAIAFLVSSNRLVYDNFYINTHIEVAVYLLVAIAGSWLAVTTGDWKWMLPAGLSLSMTMLFRPEAPLIVAMVMVAIAGTRVRWPARLAVAVPCVGVGAVWYGVILWRHAAGGDVVSLTAPVFGNLLVLGGGVVILVAGGFPRLHGLIRNAHRVVVGGLAVVLAVLAVANPGVFMSSLGAAFQNVALSQGAWLFTWSVALVLLVFALLVQRVPHSQLWTTPIVGFLLTWLSLPMIRGGPWRVGTGDSGNRILAHMLAVVVAFLVLAAVQSWSSLQQDTEDHAWS